MRLLRHAAFALLLAGCPSEKSTPSSSPLAEAPSPRVELPEATFPLGSDPRTRGRSALLEADRKPTTLAEFIIDRRLARGPDGRPLTAKTRAEAAATCEAASARLCTELEWERACAGPQGRIFATGASFDAAGCSDAPCSTPEGVAELGTRLAEWTSSAVRLTTAESMTVVRGSAAAAVDGHRCAARRLVADTTIDPGIGFRCCVGDPSESTYPMEPERPLHEPVELDQEAARRALAGVAELAAIAPTFRFVNPSVQDELAARGATHTPPVLVPAGRIVRTATRFTPSRGDSVIVLSGVYEGGMLVAALHPLEDGTYVHAASLNMPGDTQGVLLFTRDATSRALGFSSCLGCGGESGEVEQRADGRFVIATR